MNEIGVKLSGNSYILFCNKMAQELPIKVKESIQKIIQRENFVSHDVETKKIYPDGSGFMGDLYVVDVRGTTKDGCKEMSLFVKQIIHNAERISIYSVEDIFAREALAYRELCPVFEDLQIEAGIPENERFKTVTKQECTKDVIILENVCKKGYKTYYRMDVVSPKFAELAIKELARFHGLSLVLEKQRPKYFDEVFKRLKQPFIFGEAWNDFVGNVSKSSIKLLDDDKREKYGDKIMNIVHKYEDYISDTKHFSTLCHGDYKNSNIMVKEKNGACFEVLPIDFQILHYGCPINDLIYFIFTGTDQAFRKEHMENLKDLYYETLKNFVSNFGVRLTEVISKGEFDELFKSKLDFGLMINCFYVPFMFSAENDVPDVTEPLGDISFKTDERFGIRFREVVDDFIEWGYL